MEPLRILLLGFSAQIDMDGIVGTLEGTGHKVFPFHAAKMENGILEINSAISLLKDVSIDTIMIAEHVQEPHHGISLATHSFDELHKGGFITQPVFFLSGQKNESLQRQVENKGRVFTYIPMDHTSEEGIANGHALLSRTLKNYYPDAASPSHPSDLHNIPLLAPTVVTSKDDREEIPTGHSRFTSCEFSIDTRRNSFFFHGFQFQPYNEKQALLMRAFVLSEANLVSTERLQAEFHCTSLAVQKRIGNLNDRLELFFSQIGQRLTAPVIQSIGKQGWILTAPKRERPTSSPTEREDSGAADPQGSDDFYNFTYDKERNDISFQNVSLLLHATPRTLTATQRKVFGLLFEARGAPRSREAIYAHIYPSGSTVGLNIIDQFVSGLNVGLQTALENLGIIAPKPLIKALRGQGYRLVEENFQKLALPNTPENPHQMQTDKEKISLG